MNIIHSSKLTKDWPCDGKPCFEVLVRRHRHVDTERYWCGYLHTYFDPEGFECPKRETGNETEHGKPQFNRGWKKL